MTIHQTRFTFSERARVPVKTPVQARQGVTGHNVRYVLAASLAAIVVAFAMIYFAAFA